jgi:hypothetical protein
MMTTAQPTSSQSQRREGSRPLGKTLASRAGGTYNQIQAPALSIAAKRAAAVTGAAPAAGGVPESPNRTTDSTPMATSRPPTTNLRRKNRSAPRIPPGAAHRPATATCHAGRWPNPPIPMSRAKITAPAAGTATRASGAAGFRTAPSWTRRIAASCALARTFHLYPPRSCDASGQDEVRLHGLGRGVDQRGGERVDQHPKEDGANAP